MLQVAASENFFSDGVNKALSQLKEFTTIQMSEFLDAPYNTDYVLSKLCAENNATAEDYDRMYQLLDAVAERSARHAAAILVAAVVQSGEGKLATKPVCILCNGSTFYKTHMINNRVHGYLDEILTKQYGLYWDIVSVDDDITLGTAIAGLIES